MNFKVKLPLFEGPFDLLLFFIQRDELDIHDIPISKITDDFLDYIKHMEDMNVDIASEFILVAATLMRIKAKMLLPRPVLDEAGEEVDPREELIRHLLEYKKYKSVIAELSRMEADRLSRQRRGNVVKEIRHLAEASNVETELQHLHLYKLLKVYRRALDRYDLERNRPVYKVAQYPYTISDQRIFILSQLRDKNRMSFIEVIGHKPEKIAVIFNFLAILELLQMRTIGLHLGEGFNNFWIEKKAAAVS